MNIDLTWKAVGVLVLGLFAAGVIGALLDNQYAGLPVLFAAIYYLANNSKKR